MRAADRAWLVLGVGVVVYDLAAPAEETLSEGADRYLLSHKWLTRFVCVGLVAHVANFVPARFDVVHWLFVGARSVVGSARVTESCRLGGIH